MLCVGDVLLGGELGQEDGIAGQPGESVGLFLDDGQVFLLLFLGKFSL